MGETLDVYGGQSSLCWVFHYKRQGRNESYSQILRVKNVFTLDMLRMCFCLTEGVLFLSKKMREKFVDEIEKI